MWAYLGIAALPLIASFFVARWAVARGSAQATHSTSKFVLYFAVSFVVLAVLETQMRF
jgi:hypothetical protein